MDVQRINRTTSFYPKMAAATKIDEFENIIIKLGYEETFQKFEKKIEKVRSPTYLKDEIKSIFEKPVPSVTKRGSSHISAIIIK